MINALRVLPEDEDGQLVIAGAYGLVLEKRPNQHSPDLEILIRRLEKSYSFCLNLFLLVSSIVGGVYNV